MLVPETVLKVDKLGFRVGSKTILQNISFQIAAGEYMSIVRPADQRRRGVSRRDRRNMLRSSDDDPAAEHHPHLHG